MGGEISSRLYGGEGTKSSNSSKNGLEFVEITGYQVTVSASVKEDSICPLQNLFLWFFVMRPKPPFLATRRQKKKIVLFRQNKLYSLNMTRWHGAPTRTPRFMRQLSFISVFSKKEKKKKIAGCWLLIKNRTLSHLFLSPLSSSVLSQFSPHSNAKMPLFGEFKKMSLGMISFIYAGISMNSITSLSDSITPKLWFSRRYFAGFNRSVC